MLMKQEHDHLWFWFDETGSSSNWGGSNYGCQLQQGTGGKLHHGDDVNSDGDGDDDDENDGDKLHHGDDYANSEGDDANGCSHFNQRRFFLLPVD